MHNFTKGLHLIFTGYVKPEYSSLLLDKEYLSDTLTECVGLVGMEILLDPIMVEVEISPENQFTDLDDGGVTGVSILSTSHVSIHTWPLHDRLSFDLYSCHDFDYLAVMDYLTDRLCLSGGDIHIIDRTPPENKLGFNYL
jgi:S-adenosylmethionine/arginine decarboxylase-like enzyme